MTRFGFLSTYPPTRCGLATFTEALARAVTAEGVDSARIVRVVDDQDGSVSTLPPARTTLRGELRPGDARSALRAAAQLSRCDVAIVQHEYGIYGGRDGDEVLAVIEAITAPTIVVLHTVLADPTPHQREVLVNVCDLASGVVVMTRSARTILAEIYGVDASFVQVIPHGVARLAVTPAPHTRKRVLTWGLISPGKGIEWAIRAMAQFSDDVPSVEYIVAGQTHPKVLARSGEAYRDLLSALVDELGLSDTVTLYGRYLDDSELAALVASADVVLLPYDSRDQATSGVLAEAVAAGIPVVATRFPHAVELLADGAGVVVPHQDPLAMARAVRTILTAEDIAGHMRAAALRTARLSTWPAVADRYRALAARLRALQAA